MTRDLQTLREEAQRYSPADQLWLIEKLAYDLSLRELFEEPPPEVEAPPFNPLLHHSIVELNAVRLCVSDMAGLEHGVNSILVPGAVKANPDMHILRERRQLPYRVTGCHTNRLSTFLQGEAFTDTLARFQNNPDFDDIEDPATTIIWLRRSDDGQVSCDPAAAPGDDAVPEPAEEGDEQ